MLLLETMSDGAREREREYCVLAPSITASNGTISASTAKVEQQRHSAMFRTITSCTCHIYAHAPVRLVLANHVAGHELMRATWHTVR